MCPHILDQTHRIDTVVSLSGEMKEERPSLVQTAFVWFLRVMAAFAMVAGLSYWAQLIGVDNDQLPRFDLLELHWQVPGVVLAVLLPCAAMGLWMLTTWGIVLWGASLCIEIAMYGVWAERYVSKPQLVASHAVSLAVLAAFLIIIVVQRWRRRVNDY